MGEKYLATGDIEAMMPTGELVFSDRIKRMTKRPDGHQVNADTIEKALSPVEGTKEICVVGLKYRDMLGVISTAFIETLENVNKHDMVKSEQASVDKLSSFRDKALAYVFASNAIYSKWEN